MIWIIGFAVWTVCLAALVAWSIRDQLKKETPPRG